ncbi:hypothetical protein [Candidatus Uabimicrobium sp. HlEnr_7]|uniref:hypothetical protein n=1 Tax=Candidatus Uabimicrobium helgolandensis TaxID=3095367 RepID=UPI0035580005
MQNLFIFIIIILCISGCISSPKLYDISILTPAEISISKYKTIAVIPLEGELSRNAVSKINAKINSSNMCNTVSENFIQQNSQTYNTDKLANIRLQTDALIFVKTKIIFNDEEVSEKKLKPDFSDDPHKSQIEEIEERIDYLEKIYESEIRNRKFRMANGEDEEKMTSEIKELDKEYLKKYNQYEMQLDELKSKQSTYKQNKIDNIQIQYTRQGKLAINMSIDFVNAKTQKIVTSKQYEKKKNLSRKGINHIPERIDPRDEYNSIISSMVKNFSHTILPYYVKHSFYVEELDHPDFQRGMTFFLQKSYDETAQVFQKIYEQSHNFESEKKAKAYYNYGLVLSLSSNVEKVEKGTSILQQAYNTHPKEYYKKTLNFSQGRKSAILKIQSQTNN